LVATISRPFTGNIDLFAIQHEGTLAELKDNNPATIQFEDPLNYSATYNAAGVDFIAIANNHQVSGGGMVCGMVVWWRHLFPLFLRRPPP
jgi:hypothetical protein